MEEMHFEFCFECVVGWYQATFHGVSVEKIGASVSKGMAAISIGPNF